MRCVNNRTAIKVFNGVRIKAAAEESHKNINIGRFLLRTLHHHPCTQQHKAFMSYGFKTKCNAIKIEAFLSFFFSEIF